MSQPHDKTPSTSAAETYTQVRSDIARLLDVLDMELDRHRERAQAKPRSTGHTGDLMKVRSDLIGVVAFIAGMEPREVERFLND